MLKEVEQNWIKKMYCVGDRRWRREIFKEKCMVRRRKRRRRRMRPSSSH